MTESTSTLTTPIENKKTGCGKIHNPLILLVPGTRLELVQGLSPEGF